MGVLYLRSCRRHPVWLGIRLGLSDGQGAIPRSWCPACGGEVFSVEAVFCERCLKEDMLYGNEVSFKPL